VVNHRYELSNFRGDVRMTISDIKIRKGTENQVADYYVADVRTATDAYAYGWEQAGRYFPGNDDYRFSHNGMESSPEIGSGMHTSYFRQLDTRIARWWSTDPVTHSHFSPYNIFDGNPVFYADPSGADSEGGNPGDPDRSTVSDIENTLLAAQTDYNGETGGGARQSVKNMKNTLAGAKIRSTLEQTIYLIDKWEKKSGRPSMKVSNGKISRSEMAQNMRNLAMSPEAADLASYFCGPTALSYIELK